LRLAQDVKGNAFVKGNQINLRQKVRNYNYQTKCSLVCVANLKVNH